MTYIVESITSKDVVTKFGPKPAYRVKASGEWYSYGFKRPAFKEGDTINFSSTEGKYGKEIDPMSVKTLSSGGGADPAVGASSPSPAAPRAYGPPAKVFPIPPTHGDRAIVRQNALTNARELVAAAMVGAKGGVEVGDSVISRIIAIAKQFESYTSGDLDALMDDTQP